jgi:hypothetical protein
MILFCHCVQQSNDDWKLYVTIAGSLAIALVSHWLSVYRDNKKRNVEKKEKRSEAKNKLCSEIYALCDKLHRLAVAYEYSTLTGRFYYKVSTLPEKESYDLPSTIHYRDRAERIGEKFSFALSVLVKKINELAIYWNDKEQMKRIIELLLKIHHSGLRQFDGYYKDVPNLKTLEYNYQKDLNDIENHVANNQGQYLMELQHLVGDNILAFNQHVKDKAKN